MAVLAPSGLLCNSREEEVDAFTQHWRPVFQNEHHAPNDLAWLLAYVPRVDWEMAFDKEELVAIVMQAPNT
eukprot:4267990-Amphidinium_carterae.1